MSGREEKKDVAYRRWPSRVVYDVTVTFNDVYFSSKVMEDGMKRDLVGVSRTKKCTNNRRQKQSNANVKNVSRCDACFQSTEATDQEGRAAMRHATHCT